MTTVQPYKRMRAQAETILTLCRRERACVCVCVREREIEREREIDNSPSVLIKTATNYSIGLEAPGLGLLHTPGLGRAFIHQISILT
jgi:hypothetical protein